jgi:hypothetical protein
MANQQSNVLPMSKPEAKGSQFEVQAVVDGFPVCIRIEGRADDLRAIVDRLKAIGATPPAAAAGPVTPGAAPVKPVCSIHNTPMKASRKPGAFYCPKRDDSGDFCDAKA